MKAFAALSTVLATASAGIVAPLQTAYAGLPAPYAAGYLPYGYNGYNVAPAPYAAPVVAPVAPVAPAIPTPVSSQYQARDELGNINYGYSNINSAKQEVGNAYGGVTGSYQYIDANGVPQRVDYIADDLGFRVKATNLPVAPAVPETPALAGPEPVVYNGVAPTPVQDTPEVEEAKAAFFKAFDEAKNREKRSVITAPLATPLAYSGLPLAYNGYNAYNGIYAGAYNYGYAAATPLTYAAPAAAYAPYAAATPVAYNAPVVSAPAAREAVLTTVKLNPGHAVAYRVD